MAKILLVEDDQNLSEIYSARLGAEGYEIVSAANGEDALAIAAREKPDLVISDVMMPRVSGFEMLDILKHTDGTQNVKTIMLTALGQDNDRAKASELGADKYLVKSQVTLEDIVNTAKELLGDTEEPAPAQPVAPAASEPQPAASSTPLTTSPAATPLANEPVAAPTVAQTTPAATTADQVAPSSTTAPDPAEPTAAAINQTQVTVASDDTASLPTQPSPAANPVSSPGAATNTSFGDDSSTPQNTAADASNSQVQPAALETSAVEDSTDSSQPTTGHADATPASASLASNEAEPLAQEEAELQQQLNNSSNIVDTTITTPTDSASGSTPLGRAPAESTSISQPSATQPEQASNPAATEPASAPPVSQANPVNAPTPNPAPTSPPPAPAPAPVVQQTTQQGQSPVAAPAPAPQPDHDAVLAAALKELEGETSPPANNTPAPAETDDEDAGKNNAIAGRKVIQPIGGIPGKPDINQLLDQEAKNEIVSNHSQALPDNPDGNESPGEDPNSISL